MGVDEPRDHDRVTRIDHRGAAGVGPSAASEGHDLPASDPHPAVLKGRPVHRDQVRAANGQVVDGWPTHGDIDAAATAVATGSGTARTRDRSGSAAGADGSSSKSS